MLGLIILYSAIVLASTMLGSLTGMGGGVIIKPVMDMLGHYSAVEIGVLTSVCVLVMSVVSVLRRVLQKARRPAEPSVACALASDGQLEEDAEASTALSDKFQTTRARGALLYPLLLGMGSVLGGLAGQIMFDYIAVAAVNAHIKIIQNAVLLVLVVLIFFYMRIKHKIGSLNIRRMLWLWYALTGIFLGLISSFLGIGGGPMNVAILMLLFGIDIKKSVFYSLVTIIFAQISKLTVIALTVGFPVMDYTLLPFIAAAGAVGALLGACISEKVSGKGIGRAFEAVQLLVAALCIYNIVASALI